MNWLLILNIVIAVIGVAALLVGMVMEDDDWIAAGAVILVIVGLVGFLLIGLTVNIDNRITILDAEMIRSDKSIILEDYGNSGKLYVFDKMADFNIITDTTTFFLEFGYNMYNYKTDHKKVYYVDDRNNICEGKIR